jgi:hypothetical protein
MSLGGSVAASALADQPARSVTPDATSSSCSGHGTLTPTANVTATDGKGNALAADPVLDASLTPVISVSGFAAGADVAIRLANTTRTTHQSANAAGVLAYAMSLNSFGDADYKLLFQGAFPGMGSAGGGAGNIAVSVPTIGIFPFSVRCASAATPQQLTLKLTAKPTAVASGKKTTLTATATSTSGTAAPALGLQLWASVARGAWKQVATASTNSHGIAKFSRKLTKSTRFQVRYPGGTVNDTTYDAAKSTATSVAVVPKLTLAVATHVATNAKTQVTVSVSPKQKARTVYLFVDGKKVAHAKTNAKGKVTFAVRFAAGRHKVRGYLPASKSYGKSYSKTRTITAR